MKLVRVNHSLFSWLVRGYFLICLAGHVVGQSANQHAISMAPFSDSMAHWYGIRDAGNIINPKANQPRYPESEFLKIAENILLYQRNNGGWPKKLRYAGHSYFGTDR